MYCKKCGVELKDEAIFCHKCGFKLETSNGRKKVYRYTSEKKMNHAYTEQVKESSKSDEDISNPDCVESLSYKEKCRLGESTTSSYLYFKSFTGENRNKIIVVLKSISKVITAIIAISIVKFIIDQIQLGENLKILVYIIRFLVKYVKYFLLPEIIEIIIKLLEYKEENLINKQDSQLLLILTCSSFALALFAFWVFIFPSEALYMKWFGAIAFGSIFDFLSTISINIVALIIAGCINYYIDEKMLIKENIQ